jgi:hypothetical protein
MGYTKRTTRSTGKGSRTTSTRTITNKGTTRQTSSRSTGSKTQRLTTSTSFGSGSNGRTKHYVTTNAGGWRKTTLLNPVTKTKKPPKAKMPRRRNSKNASLGLFGWAVLIIIALSLLNS